MPMPARRGLAGLAVAACAAMIAGAVLSLLSGDARTFWATPLLFAVAGLLAAWGHSLSQRMDPVGRYLARRRPLAGPPPGAELPG